jgi:hypothetical protein
MVGEERNSEGNGTFQLLEGFAVWQTAQLFHFFLSRGGLEYVRLASKGVSRLASSDYTLLQGLIYNDTPNPQFIVFTSTPKRRRWLRFVFVPRVAPSSGPKRTLSSSPYPVAGSRLGRPACSNSISIAGYHTSREARYLFHHSNNSSTWACSSRSVNVSITEV